MTQILQLLAFVAAIGGLLAFGFYRDRKEHDNGQRSIYFPEHRQEEDEEDKNTHRGAAMSRLL